MRATPRVSVIILVQKNAGQALAAVKALALATSSAVAYETIVLLNGADDATVSALQRGAGAATVIVSASNLGFGGGCNFAAQRSRSEYLAFLNDDTLVDAGWLEALVDHADGDSQIAAVGSRVRFPDGTLQEAGSILWADGSAAPIGRGLPADGGAWSFRRDVTYASACALLVRRTDFESIGGFDEAYFPAYYEDVDLCLAFAAIGKRVTFEPTAQLVHFESQSSTSAFKSYLFRRNRDRLTRKWRAVLPSFEPPDPLNPLAVERAIDAAWGKRANVLLIDDRLPDAGLGSGYGRTLELIADLADSPYRVWMFPSAQQQGVGSVGAYGVDVIQRPLMDELRDPTRRYDIAIISRPHNYERFAEAIRNYQPGCSLCYDVESLFYRRIEKQAGVEKSRIKREALLREADLGRASEFAIARNAERLVCISTDERAVLESVPAHAPIDFLIPVARRIAATITTFAEREPLALFVAGWMAGPNSPNADALRWLAQKVVPLLRERVPYARIAVTGANPPESLLEYASAALQFTGYVSDLSELYARARVALSPLRFGAGVKIKTIEAIQYGLPVVSTKVGAEGLDIASKDALVVRDDARRFADEIATTLTDPAVWERRYRAAVTQSVAWKVMNGRTWRDVCDAMCEPQELSGAI